MRAAGAATAFFIMTVAAGGHASGWSLLEEVTVIEPGLGAELVWELIDTKTYCQSDPNSLDRLSCRETPDPAEFWIGMDAAGNRYGTINTADFTGEFFDIFRRPAGTRQSQHIARITRRTEPVFGEVTKLFAASRWEVDLTNGEILIGLTGSCFDSACAAQADTTDHMALIKITGLVPLMDLAATYLPPSTITFRVPARPEGLNAGSRFDVYAGDASVLPDLSLAQPVACDVGGGSLPGDVVSVTDPLPAPPPGEVRFYVTTVRNGPQRRAGRGTSSGAFVGRDASGLPACP